MSTPSVNPRPPAEDRQTREAAPDKKSVARLAGMERLPFISSGALLIWLLLQWGALALAALRVPLAAQYPQPAELHAVALLLAVQLAGSAVLFPMLCRGWDMTTATIACGCVMLLVAAALAGWALSWALAAMGIFALWVLGLWLWHDAFGARRARAVIAACAATYVIGGALLWYFRLEASGGVEPPVSLANGLLQLVVSDPQSPPSAAWWSAGIVAGSGLLVRAISLGLTWRRRRSTASR